MDTIFPEPGKRPLRRRGLRDDVYEQILDLLQDGTLAPGTKLSIDRIARELDVSPTPVREALVKLESTHLVRREALRGYKVAEPLTAEQLDNLANVRKPLEVTAIRLAAARIEDLVAALEVAHADHRAAAEHVIEAETPVPLSLTKQYFAADRRFHIAILEAANNPYLLETYNGLAWLNHRMRQAAHRGPDDAREALAEHHAILAALRAGDLQEAEDATTVHIENGCRRAVADSVSATAPLCTAAEV